VTRRTRLNATALAKVTKMNKKKQMNKTTLVAVAFIVLIATVYFTFTTIAPIQFNWEIFWNSFIAELFSWAILLLVALYILDHKYKRR
jgi:hypothetical protein